jgi:hypothetical protein
MVTRNVGFKKKENQKKTHTHTFVLAILRKKKNQLAKFSQPKMLALTS